MIRLQQLIGLPVIVMDTGKQVGVVLDAWFDEHWRLQGLVLEYAKWFAIKVRTVPWSSVLSCGEDAVFIKDESQLMTSKRQLLQRGFSTGVIHLKDMPIITVTGSQLGRVSDVYFHPLQDTQIVGYELTDGFVSDLMEGRKWLKAPRNMQDILLGQDAIIVPAVSESELEPVAASNFRG
ncbi:hypothetical protein J40TS1_25040 [Paenibacillus montaniterrae]|uniref:PRC-barrel domain-containing protein n=1 Tax=Paenibacillus montaniterrae TaxID=429341 RepID=A0A919YLY1_9BACL|nr:PRC-barrel domain-containing protein [Paenibacillus montaniterrae]GIP16862.1 hypothetical protein J40TS1_25040 [Paenibacillus montaniterrae]